MTANTSIDLEAFLHEQLAQASPDLMREMLGTLINALLCAQADTVCGAPYATRTLERVNSRNGSRHRDLHTKAGTLDVAIPKLREGTSFRDLTARGLSGVALVTSDAHTGLIAAIGATLPDASWLRCRTH